MAGGSGSTGGIGAQSPAANPPSPMGQAGNQIAGQIGNMAGSAFGGAQQPMLQTGQFGSQPIPMGPMPNTGGNVDMGMNYTPGMQQTGYDPNLAAMFGGPNGQQDPRMMGGDGFTPGFGQQQFTPEMMANMQQAFQAAQQAPQQLGGQPNPYLAQVEQQQMAQRSQEGAMRGAQQLQQQSPAGLAALLGGKPMPQTPAAQPAPMARQAPAAQPAPVAAKPSVVPPRTPPAVASAIQKLAMKNPMGRR